MDPGAEAGTLVRARVQAIVARWRDLAGDSLRVADDSPLVWVVLSVATAVEDRDASDAHRRAAETLMAGGTELARLLRQLAALRGALVDPLAGPLAGHPDAAAGRRCLDAAVDAVAEAAAAIATDRLEQAAFADALTGLPNRRAMERDLVQQLARARRRGLTLTVVVGDLDGLKRVNDSDGHPAGDRLLQAMADGLRSALRAEDGAYRVGGDEFVVLLADVSSADAAKVMARARGRGAPRFSWGAAEFPRDGSDGATLLEAADRRLLEWRGRSREGRPSAGIGRRGDAAARRGLAARATAVLVATAIAGGGGVAAAAGSLPAPAQRAVHDALERIHVHVPAGNAPPPLPAPPADGPTSRQRGADRTGATGVGEGPISVRRADREVPDHSSTEQEQPPDVPVADADPAGAASPDAGAGDGGKTGEPPGQDGARGQDGSDARAGRTVPSRPADKGTRSKPKAEAPSKGGKGSGAAGAPVGGAAKER